MKTPRLIFAMALALSGCATILKGTTDHITVVTDPPGARVSVNGEDKGVSPVTFPIASDQTASIQVTKDGYQTEEVENEPTERSGYALWDVARGLIPLLIDRSDGAVMGHETTTTAVHLKPK
jgi:hypothetical protein